MIGGQYELEDVGSASLDNRRYREFEEVVMGSRDRFTRRRSYEWSGLPFERKIVPKIPMDWETRKYGGSDFFRDVGPDNKYKWDWAGMDTAGLYTRSCKLDFDGIDCDSWGNDKFNEFVPVWAWGAAHALDESAGNNTFFDYGFTTIRQDKMLWGQGAWRNPNNSKGLLKSVVPNQFYGDHVQHKIAEIEGLRKFYDFRDDGGVDEGPEVIAIYVKDHADINSQRRILQDSVPEEFDTQGKGGLILERIGAVAKAQPYFSRPADLEGWARADGLYEHGNLYNPYWQPRLKALTEFEKLAAAALVTEGEIIGAGGNGE